jgi:peptidoglycan/LPS O-acetylase OafA/YrhL
MLPIREETARMLAVVGLVAIAVIHILDAAGTFASTRYIFWLYMAVIVGAIPGTLLLAHWSSRMAWVAPALLAAGPLLGYIVSRTIGLPGDGADVGNWLDTLGMASLFVETGVLSLSLLRLGTADGLLARLERLGR